jgi:hypothetical protein
VASNVGIENFVKGLPQAMTPLHAAFVDNFFDKALQVGDRKPDSGAARFNQAPTFLLIKKHNYIAWHFPPPYLR